MPYILPLRMRLEACKCSRITYQARTITKQLIHDHVVWCDPANPVEHRECRKQVARQDVPQRRSGESIEEKSFSTYTTPITDSSVLLGM